MGVASSEGSTPQDLLSHSKGGAPANVQLCCTCVATAGESEHGRALSIRWKVLGVHPVREAPHKTCCHIAMMQRLYMSSHVGRVRQLLLTISTAEH